jgi:hypothetical protein
MRNLESRQATPGRDLERGGPMRNVSAKITVMPACAAQPLLVCLLVPRAGWYVVWLHPRDASPGVVEVLGISD